MNAAGSCLVWRDVLLHCFGCLGGIALSWFVEMPFGFLETGIHL